MASATEGHQASTKEAGDALEQYVASLYRALGSNVEADVILAGNQIDLLVSSSVPGIGDFRTMIEVKFRANGQISKRTALEFADVARALLHQGLIERAVLVSNRALTRNAKQLVAADSRLGSATVDELEGSIFSVHASLLRAKAVYESNPLSQHFIDLRAEILDPTDEQRINEPVNVTELLELALREPDSAVILFADFGGGKSTSLSHLHYLQCIAHLAEPSSTPIPLLLTLKDFAAALDLESFVLAALQRQFAVAVPISLFWKALDSGRFLILLDGFDEISLKAGPHERAEYLRRLSPVLFGPSPAVLSSRPGYFLTRDEYQTALEDLRSGRSFDRVAGKRFTSSDAEARLRAISQRLALEHAPPELAEARDARFSAFALLPLDPDQVASYLGSYEKEFAAANVTTEQVLAFIERVYDLEDLVKRPIILQMFASMIIARDLDVSGELKTLGPSDLYELYTDAALEKDQQKGPARREVLNPALRRSFAEQAAVRMFDNDSLVIEPDDVRELVTETISGLLPAVDPRHAMTDLRTCSFLTINESDGVRFIHKSFQEFFLARVARRQIAAGDLRLLRQQTAPEVLYFLGSFGISDIRFAEELAQIAQQGTGRREPTSSHPRGLPEDVPADRQLRANATAAVCAMTGNLRELDLINIAVPSVARRRLAFRNCWWKSVAWTRLTVREELLLERVEFTQCFAYLSEVGAVAIRHSVGDLALEGSAVSIEVEGSVLDISMRGTAQSLAVRSSQVLISQPDPASTTISSLDCSEAHVALSSIGQLTVSTSLSSVDLDHRPSGHSTHITGRASVIRLRPRAAMALTGQLDGCCIVAVQRPPARKPHDEPPPREVLELVDTALLADISVRTTKFGSDLALVLGGTAISPPTLGVSFQERVDPDASLLPDEAKADDYVVPIRDGNGILVVGNGPSFGTLSDRFHSALVGLTEKEDFAPMDAFLESVGMPTSTRSTIAKRAMQLSLARPRPLS